MTQTSKVSQSLNGVQALICSDGGYTITKSSDEEEAPSDEGKNPTRVENPTTIKERQQLNETYVDFNELCRSVQRTI
jgi:hypothetical protein